MNPAITEAVAGIADRIRTGQVDLTAFLEQVYVELVALTIEKDDLAAQVRYWHDRYQTTIGGTP